MPTCLKGKCLFERITDRDNFYWAYRKTLENGGKYRPEAIKFASNETYNLSALRQSLLDGTYEFEGYTRFVIYEPKERIIYAPHYKDKIVQQAINVVLKEVYMPSLIADTYACLNGRGTHRCADRIQHFIRKAKWLYGNDAFVVKVDIEKFFYTIDRAILKRLLAKKVTCPRTLQLIYTIIDSADEISPKGMPLGNTISQICANVYLDRLDQFAKRKLGLKYYIRYMDDIVVILPDRDTARIALAAMSAFVEKELRLKVNKSKTKIFPISQGVNVVGFKIYATHRLLRDNCKRRIKRKVKAMPRLIVDGGIPILTAERMVNSWQGHAKHAASHNFMRRLMQRNAFLYRSGKTLKLDPRRIGGK